MNIAVAWGLFQWACIIFGVAFLVRRSKRKQTSDEDPAAHRARVAGGLGKATALLVVVPLVLVVLGILLFLPLTPVSMARDLIWNSVTSEMKYDKDDLQGQAFSFKDGRDAHYAYRASQGADGELLVDTNFPGDEHPIDRFYLRKACAEIDAIYARDDPADVEDSPNARRVTCREVRSAVERRQVRRLRREVRFTTGDGDALLDFDPRWYVEDDPEKTGRSMRILHSRQRPALIVMTEQGDEPLDLSENSNLCRAYSKPWRSIAKHWHIETIRKTQPPVYDPDGWGVVRNWGDRPYASAAVEVICAPGSDRRADAREAARTRNVQSAGLSDEVSILIGIGIMVPLAALWCDAWGVRTRIRDLRT